MAEAYARTQAPVFVAPAATLVDLLEIGRGARALDVGTGTGVAARALASKAGPDGLVVGIDASVGMLRQAVREDAAPRFAAATAIDLPFRDGTFGFVTACFVVSHFQRYETALYDILRVLARGGRMGITTWGPHDEQDDFRRTWRGVAEQFSEVGVLNDAMRRALPWEELFADRDRMKEVLHEAGLRDIWIEKRDYRTEVSAEDYLTGRETAAAGRFLRQMLGEELWEVFRGRVREAFATRFPERFNDFREVILAVGHKP